MKKDTMGEGLYIALGLLAVTIFVAVVLPFIRSVVADSTTRRPTIPTSFNTNYTPESFISVKWDLG